MIRRNGPSILTSIYYTPLVSLPVQSSPTNPLKITSQQFMIHDLVDANGDNLFSTNYLTSVPTAASIVAVVVVGVAGPRHGVIAILLATQ